jgi:hypothetical protein
MFSNRPEHHAGDYYRYMNSLVAYRKSVDNPFAEPVNLYADITNGYGIFCFLQNF